LLHEVMTDGKASWSEDQLLLMHRFGFIEETYFTWSYSPIRDESGGVGGVFTAVTETTKRVLGERRLETLQRLGQQIGHSKTTDMGKMARSVLPGDLTYAIVALSLLDNEIVSARFFRLNEDGSLAYLTQQEVDELPPPTPGKLGPGSGPSGRRSPFANVELVFRARSGGPLRTFRHIGANLDNTHMKADGRLLEHLKAKGTVAVMTKAASFLLWWDDFSAIRDHLLAHTAWMISDASGIPPRYADPAGFEEITYGDFTGPYFTQDPIDARSEFIKLWKDQPHRDLPFRFGYPDKEKHNHLLVTRPKGHGDQ